MATDATGYTSTVPAQGTTPGTVIQATPSAGYVTSTYTQGPSGYTTTLVTASDSTTGTVAVVIPTAGYVTTVYASGTKAYTSIIKSASGTNSGTVAIVYKSGAYVSTTTTYTGATTSSSTSVTASGSKVGTIVFYVPPGYTTTTITSGTAATPRTTTVAPMTGTTQGTVQVIQGQGYNTAYTNIASSATGYTSTIAQPNAGAPGTVMVGVPSRFTTVTTLSGTLSSTTTVQPSAPAQGTVVVENPAASQAACGNQGMSWAYWNNTQGTNGQVSAGTSDGYSQFDPTIYKTIDPYWNDTTGSAGGINNPSTNAAILISIYGDPNFNATYFTLGQRGYLYAEQTGNITFTIGGVDDWLGIWLGQNAYSGWTKQNANFQVGYVTGPGTGTFKYLVSQPKTYIPFRMVFGQAQGAAVFNVTIANPDGTYIATPTTGYGKDIVQYGCGNDYQLAPAFADWGNEF